MEKRRFVWVFLSSLMAGVMLSTGWIYSDAVFKGEKRRHIKLRLEEVLSIGNRDDECLFQWAAVSSDSQGSIYVTDTLDYSIKKFSSEGKMVKKKGGRGQGPGEFMAPRLLVAFERYLYATDLILPGIQVFDQELNFITRIPIKNPISDFKVVGTDQIIVVPFAISGPGRIFIYDGKGRRSLCFTCRPESEDLMMDHFSLDCDDAKNFFLAYTFQDKVERYDARGAKIWEKSLMRTKSVKTKEILGHRLPIDIIYKDVALDGRGHVFVLAGSFAENPGRDVYVLDLKGSLVDKLTLPETSHCLYIDSHDYIYVRADEGITLKKYKIHYPSDLN